MYGGLRYFAHSVTSRTTVHGEASVADGTPGTASDDDDVADIDP